MKIERLQPGMPLARAVLSEVLQQLSAIEALIYLRLVAMSEHHQKIYPRNVDIWRDGASTIQALRELESRRLIKIKRDPSIRSISSVGREIEVLR